MPEDKNQLVTVGYLEMALDRALEKAFAAFFVRIEIMVDAKIDAKIEWLAASIQRQFMAMDERFDALEAELGRHHIRLVRLERDRGF